MQLIIAEKRSVAQAIAQALPGPTAQGDGYLDSGGKIISWAQGHLVELDMPEQYKSRPWANGKWRIEDLPIDPGDDWQWHVGTGKGEGRQYRILANLMRREDTEMIINACDPDREGEAIFRRIIRQAGCTKPAKRLWVASLDEEAITEAFKHKRDETDYDGLADAADARAKADWLVGMNASRAYTILYNRRMSVGRVQTPTLALVTDRDRQIRDHVAKPYWTVQVDMGTYTLTSERLDSRNKAQSLLASAISEGFDIEDVTRTRERTAPPRLYDLTGLQKDMNKTTGMTAAATLEAMQALYEAKLVTYPRTDSQYITHDDLAGLRSLTATGRLVEGFIDQRPETTEPELVVNDGKVQGHTAILPTTRLDAAALSHLDQNQKQVAVRIVRRMWEATGAPYLHDRTKVKAHVHTMEGITFTASTDIPFEQGWHAIDPGMHHQGKDQGRQGIIPDNLHAGTHADTPWDPNNSLGKVVEGRTSPPKRFTEAGLLAAMEHASRFVEEDRLKQALDDDETHSGGIGTPATRAAIIEKLVSSGYISRHGKTLESTPEGRTLVEVVAKELTDVKTTADWEETFTRIEHGEQSEDEFMQRIRTYVARIPNQARAHLYTRHVNRPADSETYGTCPRCGAPVTRRGKTWTCSTNQRERRDDGTWVQTEGCGWLMFTMIAGKTLTDRQCRRLLDGRPVKVSGLKSRKGSKFSAILRIDKDRGVAMSFK